jgi:hypothetical protein
MGGVWLVITEKRRASKTGAIPNIAGLNRTALKTQEDTMKNKK